MALRMGGREQITPPLLTVTQGLKSIADTGSGDSSFHPGQTWPVGDAGAATAVVERPAMVPSGWVVCLQER